LYHHGKKSSKCIEDEPDNQEFNDADSTQPPSPPPEQAQKHEEIIMHVFPLQTKNSGKVINPSKSVDEEEILPDGRMKMAAVIDQKQQYRALNFSRSSSGKTRIYDNRLNIV